MKFKELNPGIFRTTTGPCYTKFQESVLIKREEKEEAFNAVQLTNGSLRNFEDEEEVLPF